MKSIDVRVHQDIILTALTLVDVKEAVIILPTMAEYQNIIQPFYEKGYHLLCA
ncbi:hypothetical protein [Virgibacillus proomii]|uniref:hypothetical protein n=1 Tax=Virgibacillus proomii TaxID=84407 RepID=UPI001C101675|nr:hypothetical protein [Virgibacillus proomii]MBU5266623.1 hypothetical protein [Virgibacillus proomii]